MRESLASFCQRTGCPVCCGYATGKRWEKYGKYQ